eukprot:gene8704-650_t
MFTSLELESKGGVAIITNVKDLKVISETPRIIHTTYQNTLIIGIYGISNFEAHRTEEEEFYKDLNKYNNPSTYSRNRIRQPSKRMLQFLEENDLMEDLNENPTFPSDTCYRQCAQQKLDYFLMSKNTITTMLFTPYTTTKVDTEAVINWEPLKKAKFEVKENETMEEMSKRFIDTVTTAMEQIPTKKSNPDLNIDFQISFWNNKKKWIRKKIKKLNKTLIGKKLSN